MNSIKTRKRQFTPTNAGLVGSDGYGDARVIEGGNSRSRTRDKAEIFLSGNSNAPINIDHTITIQQDKTRHDQPCS
jgi:hypothetical protein